MPTPFMEAIVFPEPNKVELRRFELPALGANELLVRTIYTMVSSGTELRVLAGHYGAAGKFPVIPGYIVVGEVIEVGQDVAGWKVGDLVSGRNPKAVPGIHAHWGGQASHHIYTTSGTDRPVLLPAGANPLDYIVAEIGAISWRGAEAAEAVPGEDALVIGQGLIGALSAYWLQQAGCRVVVVDVAESRLQRALDRGAYAAVNARDSAVRERLKALLPVGANIVVEASGSKPGIQLAFDTIREEHPTAGKASLWPRLVLQANYLDEVSINPHSFFPGEGFVLLTPQDRRIEDRQKVVELIRTGQMDSSHFVDRVLDVREAPSAYFELRDKPEEFFSLVYDWKNALS